MAPAWLADPIRPKWAPLGKFNIDHSRDGDHPSGLGGGCRWLELRCLQPVLVEEAQQPRTSQTMNAVLEKGPSQIQAGAGGTRGQPEHALLHFHAGQRCAVAKQRGPCRRMKYVPSGSKVAFSPGKCARVAMFEGSWFSCRSHLEVPFILQFQ